MEKNKAYSFIGLMQKAGKLFSGDEYVELCIKRQLCSLIIIAEDAGENTKSKFISLAKQNNIPFVSFGTKENLGQYIGKPDRAVLAVSDKNFASSFLEKIQIK